MAYDPEKSAREKTPYGNFQLKPTHLKTAPVVFPFTPVKIDAELAEHLRWVAAGWAFGHAPNHEAAVEAATELLDCLGLLPVQ